jgi:hypothetical protein
MAAADKNTVETLLEGTQNKTNVHPAGTGDPDNTHIGRILETRNAG